MAANHKLSDEVLIGYMQACRDASRGKSKHAQFVEGFMDGLMAGSVDVTKKLGIILGDPAQSDKIIGLSDKEFKGNVKSYLNNRAKRQKNGFN
jgi:hypothetical protein